jgi:hypothetical protein
MLIRCEMLKKLANAFIEVAKEENLQEYNFLQQQSFVQNSIRI